MPDAFSCFFCQHLCCPQKNTVYTTEHQSDGQQKRKPCELLNTLPKWKQLGKQYGQEKKGSPLSHIEPRKWTQQEVKWWWNKGFSSQSSIQRWKKKEWIWLNQTTTTTHKLPNMLWGWENKMLTHSHMLKSHLNSSGAEGNTYQNPSMHLLERQTNMNQSVRLMRFGSVLRCKRRQWSAGRDNRHSQEEWLLGKLLRPSETTSGSPVHSIFASTCPSGKQRWK